LSVDIWWSLYYGACALLWVGLTGLAVWSFQPSLAAWFAVHPRARAWLLGLERLPEDAPRVLRTFYLYLAGGWTWLLVWSWWLLPWFKLQFYRSAATAQAYRVARISMLVLVAATAVFGFFCIGKAIQVWRRDLYAPSLKPGAGN
jgi:hypothetical protein